MRKCGDVKDHAGLRAGLPALPLLAVLVSLIGLSACVTKTAAIPANQYAVSFIALPPQTMTAGTQVTLSATVADDTQNLGVDWTSSCESANCGSFNPPHTLSGVSTTYTAPSTLPQGCQPAPGQAPPPCVYITAKSTAAPGQTATVSISMISQVSITLTQVPSPIAAGTTTQITAQVTGDPNNLGVDWTLQCTGGNCGSITPQTASGAPATYTAPTGITSSLSVTIKAVSVFDGVTSQSETVTITPAATVSIAFAPQGAGGPPTSMNTGAIAEIVANVSNDTQNLGVDWSVSCSNGTNGCGTLQSGNANATHTSSGAAIQYTAPTNVPAAGLQVTITATATANAKEFVSAMITVSVPVPTIGPISGAPTQLTVNSSTLLSATVTNDPASGGGVDWTVTCGDPNGVCGTFNDNSHTASGASITYTAPAAVPAGNTVTITATSHANPKSSSTVVITIMPSTAESIAFSKTNPPPSQLTTSTTASIAAVITNPTQQNVQVNWSLSCGLNQAGACGSFSGNATASTASGVAVTYDAPASVPTGGLTVTITAAASDNPKTVSISANISIVTPAITVQITQAATPLDAGASEELIATVANDSSNEGVTWKATCSNTPASNGCGTFGTSTQISGTNPPQFEVSYTAPTSISSNPLQVVITATDVSNGTSVGTANINIQLNPNLGLLKGQYVLSLRGTKDGFYALTGTIVADGAGNITQGEEDIAGTTTGNNPTTTVTGTYSIGSDGRGTMTLTAKNTAYGSKGTETLRFVVANAASTQATTAAFINEFDQAPASGTLELQTGVTAKSFVGQGNWAFQFVGEDLQNSNANGVALTDFGGVLATDGQGNVSSVTWDENDQGTGTVSEKVALTGTYTSVDQFGRGTASFTDSSGNNYFYVFYTVNSGELRFMSDGTLDTDFAVAGPVYTQGTSFSGPFVFTLAGADDTLVSTSGVSTDVVAGGIFTAGNSGLVSGSIDANDGGTLTSNASFSTSSFSAASGGRGTFTLSSSLSAGVLSTFAFYLTANHGVLLLELDKNVASAGVALPQTAGSTFSGTYAMEFSNFTGSELHGEEDADGQLTSDGISQLSGTVDLNHEHVGQVVGGSLVGSFNSTATTGRDPGSFTVNTTGFQEVFYVASADTVLFIEMDSNQSTGILVLQQGVGQN